MTEPTEKLESSLETASTTTTKSSSVSTPLGQGTTVSSETKSTVSRLSNDFVSAQNFLLSEIKVWWRPITCVGIAGGAVVNLMLIPLVTWTVPDMTAAAAYVAAAAAAFSVRAFEKLKGFA